MDRDSPFLFNRNICMSPTTTNEELAPISKDLNVLKNQVPLNNSFEDFSCKSLLSGDCSEEIQDIGHPFEAMGIENSWNDDNSFASAPAGDFPIPLPPPGGFDDIPCLDSDLQTSEHGPFHESDLGNLFSSEPEISEDVKGRVEKIGTTGKENILDPSASAGVCGLHNMGNTCFMGAGLQCLAATPALMEYFLSRPSGEKDSPHSLTEQFSSLLHKIWCGKFSVLGPDDFKRALGINHPQFKDYRQHDCQEFLALLLDHLHEQLNHASCKSVLSDMSTAPPTPYSTSDVLDERDFNRKLYSDSADHTLTAVDYLRCSQSSSSHSSESSSGESRNAFRLQPIPEGVSQFKGLSESEEPMDVTEANSGTNDVFCNQIIKDSNSSNNLITENQLKNDHRLSFEESVLDKNEVAKQYNNVSQFHGFEDILKDARTSNVNVLVTEQEINNELRFDSEKFPKLEKVRRRDAIENPNYTENHNFDGKTVSIKRIKENNLINYCMESPDYREESLEMQSSKCFNNVKRIKLGDSEKNHRMEIERKLRGTDENSVDHEEPAAASSTSCLLRSTHKPNDEIEADKFWEKHLAANQSIVVDTFQGQFKSTVVCSACGHISVTYEPFMYLSVPVPHAMERQICVTVVLVNSIDSTKYLVTLNKQDKILKLKEELFRVMGPDGPKCLVLAEVLDTHIARTLDESSYLRHVNDTNRSIYAFEVLPPPDVLESLPLDLTPDLEDVRMGMPSSFGDGLESMGPLTETEYAKLAAQPPTSAGFGDGSYKVCTICLEDVVTSGSIMRRHKSCSCILCEGCIEKSCKHHNPDGDKLTCPVCSLVVKPDTEFVLLDKSGDMKPTIRIFNVPVVFRLNVDGDGNNNKKTMKLFGHPHLIRIPNCTTGEDLHEAVARVVPYSAPYVVLLIDGQPSADCVGCIVSDKGPLMLRDNDRVVVHFTVKVNDSTLTVNHSSMDGLRTKETLSINKCMDAFVTSEQLDNAWKCPTCQKNQCGTKTLTVCRYPDFLIVYIKRFIFHDGVSVKLDNKITFPLTGLKFSSPSALQHGSSHTYDLYSCVCHFGDSTGGHYTAYSKHLASGEWHYFNDAEVTKQKPQDEHYNNGYVLFYQKQGVSYELPKTLMSEESSYELNVPKLLLSHESSNPNIDQLILDLDSSVEQDRQQEIMAHSSAS